MKNTIRAFIAFFIILGIGCANVDITKTGSGYYEPTDANKIEILKTTTEKQYTAIGTLTVTGFPSADVAKMHNAIRQKAAPLGADAVVITDEGLIPKGFGNFERWATGVAIKYN